MMWMVTVVRFGFVFFGVVFFILNFMLYSKKKMYEPFMFTWVLISLLGVIFGLYTRPWGYVGEPGAPVILVLSMVLIVILFAIFVYSSIISIHIFKTQELAMQVSLLNEENERIRDRLARIEKAIGLLNDESDRNVLADLISQMLEENEE
ncbi:MAG: hypothetical protein J6N76_06035 [Lachnospiraceae bacterium]|nr:hypothetical protein [Lachnospiraceae bacterium]